MSWRLTFEPIISTSLWLSLLLAGVVAMTWYAFRLPPGLALKRWVIVISLMSLSLAALLVILLNPTWVQQLPEPSGKPVVSLLLDDSASMTTTDGPDGERRIDAALAIAVRMRERLSRRFDVRLRRFSDQIHPLSTDELNDKSKGIEAEGMVTDIGGAITKTIAEEPAGGQAIVMLTDGIDNAGGGRALEEAARMAKAAATPIYPITLGGSASLDDIVVEIPVPQDLSFVGEPAAITASLRHEGFTGKRIQLSLVGQPGDAATEQVIESRTMLLGDDSAAVTASFEVRHETPGIYRYEVRATPAEGEATAANNSALLVLRVVEEPIRVLFLEGKPYWDSKFLLRTLMSDRNVNVDAYVRVRDSRFHYRSVHRSLGKETKEQKDQEHWEVAEDFETSLASQGGLRSFQILVLGRDSDVYLTDSFVVLLKDWVAKDGGSLICHRGAPMASLNEWLLPLMPVRWTPGTESRFQMQLTQRGRGMNWFSVEDGRSSDDLAGQLPTLARRNIAGTPNPLAVVFADATAESGSASPAFSFQPYGAGRAVVIEGAGMWRWAFLPPDRQDLDPLYPRLWRGLLRWLISSVELLPGQTLAIRPDKVRFEPTENAGGTLLVREEAFAGKLPSVELRREGSEQAETFAPTAAGEDQGVYRVHFGKLPEGKYIARAADTSAVFEVRTGGSERLHVRARPDLMARVATESGGVPLAMSASAEDMAAEFEEMRQMDEARVRVEPAWDRWWVMASVFAAWAVCWGLRRNSGLV